MAIAMTAARLAFLPINYVKDFNELFAIEDLEILKSFASIKMARVF